MTIDRFRIFFEEGSGTALWANDEPSRAAFGYAVPLTALPLPDGLRARIGAMADRFDALDKTHLAEPPADGIIGKTAFSAADVSAAFASDVATLASDIQAALPAGYLVEHDFEP